MFPSDSVSAVTAVLSVECTLWIVWEQGQAQIPYG
jgi:hypothetical protein